MLSDGKACHGCRLRDTAIDASNCSFTVCGLGDPAFFWAPFDDTDDEADDEVHEGGPPLVNWSCCCLVVSSGVVVLDGTVVLDGF